MKPGTDWPLSSAHVRWVWRWSVCCVTQEEEEDYDDDVELFYLPITPFRMHLET
jgi:hypothetical protein